MIDGVGNQPLSLILESAYTAGSVTLRPERMGNFDCYVLEGISDFGNIEAWLSPEHGFNALQYKVRTTGNQRYGDTPVAELGVEEMVLTVTDIGMTTVDGVIVPKSGTYRKQVRMKDGSVHGSVVHSERDQIELSPDFAASGAFTPRLPDGSRVSDEQFPGFVFTFMNGKMRRGIDERAQKLIDEIREGLSRRRS